MNEPTNEPDIDGQMAELRPMLTHAFHALLHNASYIDCAALVNDILDNAAEGDLYPAQVAIAMLEMLKREVETRTYDIDAVRQAMVVFKVLRRELEPEVTTS